MIKFVGGPISGLALGLGFWLTVLGSTIGMMVSVLLLVFAQGFIQPFLNRFKKKDKPIFSKFSRFAIKTKQKFGLSGIALLTPFAFTPIGGTILALAFKFPKHKIIIAMLVSAFIGGIIQTAFFYQLPVMKAGLEKLF
jgi:uncharacterized membrane protein